MDDRNGQWVAALKLANESEREGGEVPSSRKYCGRYLLIGVRPSNSRS
jgi:hypothetical protein